MPMFTDQQVAAIVEEVVSERGLEYVYPSYDGQCYYRTPEFEENEEGISEFARSKGEPGCIVGCVLDRLGVLPPTLNVDDGYHAGEEMAAHTIIRRLGEAVSGDLMSQNASWALNEAQRQQDQGRSWGLALDAFRGFLAVKAYS